MGNDSSLNIAIYVDVADKPRSMRYCDIDKKILIRFNLQYKIYYTGFKTHETSIHDISIIENSNIGKMQGSHTVPRNLW